MTFERYASSRTDHATSTRFILFQERDMNAGEKQGNSPDERGKAASDSETAMEAELQRESLEGSDAIGDVASNRNLSGSSTWETLPDSTRGDDPSGHAEQQ
jgi:hypothetical protein